MFGKGHFYLFIDRMREKFELTADQASVLREQVDKAFGEKLTLNHKEAEAFFSGHAGFFDRFKKFVAKRAGTSV